MPREYRTSALYVRSTKKEGRAVVNKILVSKISLSVWSLPNRFHATREIDVRETQYLVFYVDDDQSCMKLEFIKINKNHPTKSPSMSQLFVKE